VLKRVDAPEAELKEEQSERQLSIKLLESAADRIAVDYQKGPLQKSHKAINAGVVLPFSMSCEHLKCNPRLADVFVCFFDNEGKLRCHSEMQSNKFKSQEEKQRKATVAKFARVKKIVKLMLMNMGSCPIRSHPVPSN